MRDKLRSTDNALRYIRWYVLILETLDLLGGKLETSRLYELLEQRYGRVITPDGREKLPSGKTLRWKDEVGRAGSDLAGRVYDPPLITKGGGVWMLTERGKIAFSNKVNTK